MVSSEHQEGFTMKKALSIAVSAAMLFSLSDCGSSETIE